MLMKGLRRNDDAMKYYRWYQNKNHNRCNERTLKKQIQ